MKQYLPVFEPFLQNISPSMWLSDVAALYTPLDGFLDAPLLGTTFSYTPLRGHHFLKQGLHVRPFWREFLGRQTCFHKLSKLFSFLVNEVLLFPQNDGTRVFGDLSDEQTARDRASGLAKATRPGGKYSTWFLTLPKLYAFCPWFLVPFTTSIPPSFRVLRILP